MTFFSTAAGRAHAVLELWSRIGYADAATNGGAVSEDHKPAERAEYPAIQKADIGALAIKGGIIGIAEAIPGVSGGTLALILGVYHRLIDAIRSYTPRRIMAALKALPGVLRRDPESIAATRAVHVDFLAALGLGMAPAFLVGTKVLPALIETYRGPVYAVFFGMILASCVVPLRMMKKLSLGALPLIVIGTLAAYTLVGFSVAVTPSLPFTFVCGAIAVCALILPGVSGSYLLVALGQYSHISGALHSLDLVTVAVFAVGMAVGLFFFVRLLSFLFRRAHDPTLAVLAGLMLGSLRAVWPFQTDSGRFLLKKGEQVPIFENVWPDAAFNVPLLVGLVVVGAVIVVALIIADIKFGDAEPGGTDAPS